MTFVKSAFQPLHKAIAEQRQRILSSARQLADVTPQSGKRLHSDTTRGTRSE